jgi:hypothetical protein
MNAVGRFVLGAATCLMIAGGPVLAGNVSGMPGEMLSCVKSSIKSISDRFGKPIGGPGSNGSYVEYENEHCELSDR